MANGLSNYPNIVPADAAYPDGDIKDRAGTVSGTPVNRLVYADTHQFLAKLMRESGITPNELPDNETNGFQYVKALIQIINLKLTDPIVKSMLGSYTPDTIVILTGCDVSPIIPGSSTLSEGAIYYNGKIYLVEAATVVTTSGQTLVWKDSADLTFNVMHLEAGLSGSGLADYNLVSNYTSVHAVFERIFPLLGRSIVGATPDDYFDALAEYVARRSATQFQIRTSAADNQWYNVAYGNGVYVAVGISGTGNRVMTSPDGITWTIRSSAADNNWFGITYGNGLFVAVAITGTNRIMTSPDGITWTSRSAPLANQWEEIVYGNGLFVAVSGTGAGADIMTSPDGITWTSRTTPAGSYFWKAIAYGNGIFVAVGSPSSGNRVMTSPDGITWTVRTSPTTNAWQAITFGNGLFVAVSTNGTGNRVMTSPDGITWTARTSAADNFWNGIAFGNGLFVAVGDGGSGNRVMTSVDGINWQIKNSPVDNSWAAITYGNGLFVAVAASGTGNRVMTSV